MARVFVSWGSPDKDIVTKLVECFRAAKIDLFEYTDDMRAGEPIHKRVLNEIRLAEVALLCLSDQSVQRDWVLHECDWCFASLMDPDRPLKRLIIVEVGVLNEQNVPSILKETWLHRFSIHKHQDDIDRGINRLLNHLLCSLRSPRPLSVPATIFAMTREQAEKLSHDLSDRTPSWTLLRSLGERLGMQWPEGLSTDLLQRYGEHCLDFKPSLIDESLKDIVQHTVNWINENEKARSPIQIVWYDPKYLLEHISRKRYSWEHFDTSKHIIVIDSISMLHDIVRQNLPNLLSSLSGGMDSRALIWIPPCTQHTWDIENLIFNAIEGVHPLVSEFDRWRNWPGCFCSFDALTKSGFSHWLWNAIMYVTDRHHPQKNNLKTIQQYHPGPNHLPSRRHS